MKISVYIGISLDGYIARADGGIDWLDAAPSIEGEDYGYMDFFNTVDVLVWGRATFEKVLTFEEWPYGDTPVVVLTSRPLTIPADLATTVSTRSGEPAEIVKDLAARGYQHVYLDGGVTIQRFLRAGLVDTLILTRIPVLIGTGLPLFGPLDADIQLTHINTHTYPNGLVQSTYTYREAG